MPYIVPEYFQQAHPPEQTILLNGLTAVNYRVSQVHRRSEIFLTTPGLTILLNGQKLIDTGDRTLSFRSGEAFFLKQGYYVMGEVLENDLPFQSLLFLFEPALLKEFLTTYRVGPPQGVSSQSIFAIQITPIIQGFVNSILPLFGSSISSNQDLLRLKFFELLHYLSHSPENQEFVNFLYSISHREKQDLLTVMRENFMKPLNVEQYAQLSGRSLSAFKREFKEIFKVPPGEWLRKKRLKRAYFFLTHTANNVTDVCSESGYQNLSHFIQAFKKEFGVTPKQLAKNNTF
jgi:AraC-like DNA-binding protein